MKLRYNKYVDMCIRVYDYIRYSIPQGISNLIHYFPLVWKDRDYDKDYLLRILRYKLSRMEKNFRRNDFYMGAQNDADKMATCVRLIDRIRDDYYEMEYAEYLKEDFSLIKTENGLQPKWETIEDNLDEYFHKYRTYLKREKDIPESRKSKAIVLAIYNQGRAKDLLFKILGSEIFKWWW